MCCAGALAAVLWGGAQRKRTKSLDIAYSAAMRALTCFSYIRTSSKHAIKEARRERGETLFPADAYADAFADYVHRAVMMKLQEVSTVLCYCCTSVQCAPNSWLTCPMGLRVLCCVLSCYQIDAIEEAELAAYENWKRDKLEEDNRYFTDIWDGLKRDAVVKMQRLWR